VDTEKGAGAGSAKLSARVVGGLVHQKTSDGSIALRAAGPRRLVARVAGQVMSGRTAELLWLLCCDAGQARKKGAVAH
jgi:hypothetical protein